jgi:hypothetical protein
MSRITVTNPVTGQTSEIESNDGEQVHGVDAQGVSLGMVPIGSAYACTPEPPAGDGWRWDFALLAWVFVPTLAHAKEAKNTYINASRLKANQSFFSFAGKQIAADPLSRSDIDAINGEVSNTGSLPAGWPGAWKCMDNTLIAISNVGQWKEMYSAMVNTGTANFGKSQALKAQLAAASTIQQVDLITW